MQIKNIYEAAWCVLVHHALHKMAGHPHFMIFSGASGVSGVCATSARMAAERPSMNSSVATAKGLSNHLNEETFASTPVSWCWNESCQDAMPRVGQPFVLGWVSVIRNPSVVWKTKLKRVATFLSPKLCYDY